MAQCKIEGVRVAGIASCVPSRTESVDDLAQIFGLDDAKKIEAVTGVSTRHIADIGICTSDLCVAAAERLLTELAWERNSVDALIFISQTPDYLVPATSCVIHGRLGLAKTCATFDVTLGCSGYVYGLWLASVLLASGGCERTLILVGDTITRNASPRDRSVAPLFGDAGTATALDRDSSAPSSVFTLGTDGTGYDKLIVPASGFRHRRNEETGIRRERENGNIRSDEDLYMDGAEIFSFTLREVPPLIETSLQQAGWLVDDVDAFVFHQANEFMLKHLSKKMKLPADKVVLTLKDYGNTSSASIPLSISHALRDDLTHNTRNLVIAGFGVGMSWAAAAITCGPLVLPEIVILSPAGDQPHA